MEKSIIFMGYMGSGKTELGQRLAKMKSIEFIDLDQYIESQEKNIVSQIFEKHGEIYFRKKERQYLEELLSKDIKSVISLGGGTPCYFDNIHYIINKENITTLYLKTSPKTLAHRLFEQKDHRPMIAHIKKMEELEEYIAKHLFERVTFYSQAEHQITTDNQSLDDLVNQIENILA